MEPSKAKDAIECLTSWANDKNYTVEFIKNGDDSICPISKQIEINSSKPSDVQFYRLLHECGHALIFENGGKIKSKAAHLEKQDSAEERTFTVIEEVEAWKRGLQLAKRLKIPVDEKRWEQAMVAAIRKYILWAAKI
jgi:hypothetical protein